MHFQGARMDDQRCSLPQIKLTDNHPLTKKDEGAPRSASFSTQSEIIERLKSKEKDSRKEVHNSAPLRGKLHEITCQSAQVTVK